MLNIIWIVMIVVGILVGAINGKINEIGTALLQSSGSGVQFALGIMGVVCLWCGLMRIAADAGAVDSLSKVLRPIINFLFPETKKNKEAEKQVITNLAANFLGLGNGATPSGIKAVSELQKSSKSNVAVKGVCMFLVINSASIQLIPTTVIALRTAAGSTNPSSILIPTWICSVAGCLSSIIIFLLLTGISEKRNNYAKRKKVKQ